MEDRKNHYEGMFLVSPAEAADLDAIVEHLKDICARAGASIIALRKWDERRLAYEIAKNKRGVYFLSYLEAPPQAIAEIDRLCNLSERVLRILITRADHLTVEEMEAADARQELATEAQLRDPAESGA
jgi:small subunit ribosomal protein S6